MKKYWRNGKMEGRPYLRAFAGYLWLIPVVSGSIYFTMMRRGRFSDISEYFYTKEFLLACVLPGLMAYLISIIVNLRPSMLKCEHEYWFNQYVLWPTKVARSSISQIKVHGLGALGTYLDVTTKALVTYRILLFMGKTPKESLAQFLDNADIGVV